jgi:thiol-disulfide isomerase/thioredoxin
MTLGDLFSKGNTPKNTQLPQFSVVDINGKTHNNNTVKGKYLVVNFWATWCPPCLKEIPAFVDFYEKHSDKVEILGMDYEQADVDKIK